MIVAPEKCIFRSVAVIQDMAGLEEPGSQGCIQWVVQGLVIWAGCCAEGCLETPPESTPVALAWWGKLLLQEFGCGVGSPEAVQSPYLN